MGSWWRGRPIDWNPDRQAVEQERQRWVYERLADENNLISELTIDPDRAYAAHRAAYEQTGDPAQLMMMLEYVHG